MLTIINSFELGANAGIGLGFDSLTNSISVYGGDAGEINNYDLSGNLISSIASPGESANDFDLSFASESLTLGNTVIAADTLLAINGESGTTEIYALDPESNDVVATLFTEFGAGHIVGGDYHAQRDTFFLVQSSVTETLIAEINAVDGSILNTFSPGDDYEVFLGDLEVDSTTGNLFLVSSNQTAIRELSPEGEIIQDLTLPDDVDDLTGIGLDEMTGDIWVSNANGIVWQLDQEESTADDPTSEVDDGIPVYRFLRTDTQTQFYTTSEIERDAIVANLPNYELEGISFIGADIPEDDLPADVDQITGTVPVYRFFNTDTGIHFYTADENERAFIADNLDNFIFEGTPYYGYETQIAGTIPLYRFYNESLDAHFYTPSTEERDAFLTSPDFEPEGNNNGIAFYVEPAPEI